MNPKLNNTISIPNTLSTAQSAVVQAHIMYNSGQKMRRGVGRRLRRSGLTSNPSGTEVRPTVTIRRSRHRPGKWIRIPFLDDMLLAFAALLSRD